MNNVIILFATVALAFGCSAPQERADGDVLAAGYSLPPGFVSLQASGPRGEGQRIEAIFHDDAAGATVRYTTVRGSWSDVAPGEPIYPIDTCIRDADTGELLFPPGIFADRPLIEHCGNVDDDEGDDASAQYDPHFESEAFQRKHTAALKGLEALKSVRFKDEYEPERQDLVEQLGMRTTFDPETDLPPGRVVKEDESGRVIFFDEPNAH